MLRITTMDGTGSETVLKLEGALAAEWVPELERACRAALAQRHHVRLDFKDVTRVDRQAVATVNELRAAGVDVFNCTPLIKALLGW